MDEMYAWRFLRANHQLSRTWRDGKSIIAIEGQTYHATNWRGKRLCGLFASALAADAWHYRQGIVACYVRLSGTLQPKAEYSHHQTWSRCYASDLTVLAMAVSTYAIRQFALDVAERALQFAERDGYREVSLLSHWVAVATAWLAGETDQEHLREADTLIASLFPNPPVRTIRSASRVLLNYPRHNVNLVIWDAASPMELARPIVSKGLASEMLERRLLDALGNPPDH